MMMTNEEDEDDDEPEEEVRHGPEKRKILCRIAILFLDITE